MSLKNFLLLDDSLAGRAAGDEVTVSGSEGHHGAKVMRLRAGESVLVTDTHGHQAEGEITHVDKASFRLTLSTEPSAPAPYPVPLTLVQALAKGGRDELAVETATELGVDRVIAWQAERSIVQWKGEKVTKGRAKWQDTIHAAVKQSRRASIPQIDGVLTSAQLAERICDERGVGALILVLHESASTGLGGVIEELRNSNEAPASVWLVVGPEGGISEREIALFEEAGARAIVLGREILRASSAGPAALAALAASLGRWT